MTRAEAKVITAKAIERAPWSEQELEAFKIELSEPQDGVRFDEDTKAWVARHTILTAGPTEADAWLALRSAVMMDARTWPVQIGKDKRPAGSVADVVRQARRAVDALRDATRNGVVIEFKQRDPLVLAIHNALDLLEPGV